MNTVELPKNAALAGQLIAAQAKQDIHKLERGWMGVVFGTGAEKAGNVAAFAMILSFIALFVLFFANLAPDVPRGELLTLFGGVFTSALGYLFGRATGGHRQRINSYSSGLTVW